jgi:DNA-binding CsgD family transcriptional regulator
VTDGDLPAELSSFVGREEELLALGAALSSARLVTVAGPGGSGKTRLAARAAAALVDRWEDGACWVDLTTTADPDAVFTVVASALGALYTAAKDDLDALTAQLRDRRFLLCVEAYARRSRGTRSRPSTGWASLTPAERSVVELAADGLTNPEIGQRLFMSRGTVKTHLAHVYAKLGVANRTQLAAIERDSPEALR